MTKRQLAEKLVKDLKLREWLGDFCYGDAMRAYRIAAMSDDQMIEYLTGYSKDFLTTTVEECHSGRAEFWNRYTGEN